MPRHSLFLILCSALLQCGVHGGAEEMGRDRSQELRQKISDEELDDVFKACQEEVSQRNALERKLADQGRVVRPSDRITDPCVIRRRKTDPTVHMWEYKNLVFIKATDKLHEKHDLNSDDLEQHLPDFPLNGENCRRSKEDCSAIIPEPTCDAGARYRTADGTCNNLKHPLWGAANACIRRLLSAYYVGSSDFRTSVNGNPLPDPRTLSLNLHYDVNRPTNYATHMYMFFGQLLDHDITLTPFSTTVDNLAIQCCPAEGELHPQCAPILISPNDPFYSQFGVRCLNFVRSVICPTCAMGHRQQMNQVTSFIDGSFIYGNSENETNSLRTNDGTGRLRVQSSGVGDLLPRSTDPQNDQCSFPQTNDICFEAGDPRANQHTVLASLHTIFVREHNRLASGLRAINPQWDDNRLFQEARRILGAQMQVITYKEYLPITLGRDRMNYFSLWISDRGSTSYDPNKNPMMIHEFSTAAFRFGHSLVNSVVARRPLNATNGARLLRNEFFQPFDLYNGVIGRLVEGASDSSAQLFDRHVVPDVTNFLYRVRGNDTGLDLASFNIQRGRDHGIPPYTHMVRWCSEGQIVVRNFNDLMNQRLMGYQQAEALRRNYRNVADVDLWPGILMETPNDGAVVGPTAACIIGLMFNHLKFGDRFYFEHRNQAGSFTYQQMAELRKTSLSKIMCRNSNAYQMPLNAFLFSSRSNPFIYCRNVRGVDLSYWREAK